MEPIKDDMDSVEDNIQNNFQEAFGWFVVVNKISDQDFTKHEYVYKQNLNAVLNQLSYLIGYEQEQIRLQRKSEGKF